MRKTETERLIFGREVSVSFFTENFQIRDSGAFMRKMRDFVHKARFKRGEIDGFW